MFAVPLVVGTRFGKAPGLLLKIACVAGIGVTLLSIGFSLVPVVEVKSPWLFAMKVSLTAIVANGVGAGIYWRGSSVRKRKAALLVA
jgi:hypothetical protein